jgi:hypothetical protein
MRYLGSIGCALILALVSSSAAAHPFSELYGDRIEFKVLRNGQPVGYYLTEFRDISATEWQVDVSMELSFKVFKLLPYHYVYRAQERWQDGALTGFSNTITKNDKTQRAHWMLQNGQLIPTTQSKASPLPSQVLTTHHYNIDALSQPELLNTLTGQLSAIAPTKPTKAQIQTQQGAISAQHFLYQGDLNDTEVWYTPEGQWVKLAFSDPSGAWIEFECIQCIAPETPSLIAKSKDQ